MLDISPKNFIFCKIFNSEFLYFEVWFTDQNSKPLEIKDEIEEKPLDHAKNLQQMHLKTTGDLIGNNTADVIAMS